MLQIWLHADRFHRCASSDGLILLHDGFGVMQHKHVICIAVISSFMTLLPCQLSMRFPSAICEHI
jgi:hypothetical protein